MASLNEFRDFDIEAHQAKVRAGKQPKTHSVDCFCFSCTPQTTPPDKPAKPKRKRKAIISEHDHQCRVIKWREVMTLTKSMPGLHLLFAIPNGGQRSKGVAGKLRAEGVLAGVPDLFLPVARRGFHGLFIELKSECGKTTKLQDGFMFDVDEQGYCTAVCYSADDAIRVIENYYGV